MGRPCGCCEDGGLCDSFDEDAPDTLTAEIVTGSCCTLTPSAGIILPNDHCSVSTSSVALTKTVVPPVNPGGQPTVGWNSGDFVVGCGETIGIGVRRFCRGSDGWIAHTMEIVGSAVNPQCLCVPDLVYTSPGTPVFLQNGYGVGIAGTGFWPITVTVTE